jgi:hypothetical protein
LDLQAITEYHESPDITLTTETKDPMERTDPAEPTPPMERTEPIDPMDKNELREPMERTEFRDHSDHRELSLWTFTELIPTLGIVGRKRPSRRVGGTIQCAESPDGDTVG